MTSRASTSIDILDPDNPAIDFDAIIAKMVALAARNGVEDLHSAGAFSDKLAPALNQQIRGRVYEVLLAIRRRDYYDDHDPLGQYVEDLGKGYRGGETSAALQGAISQAVDDFGASEGIDVATTTKLRKAAVKAGVEAWRTANRLALRRSKDEEKDQFAVQWWLRSIPDYWEEPQVRPEFQRLLDSTKRRP